MDLKKLLKSSKYLEESQVKSIVYDMLCGLNYLHKSQIIHRDLKPANILINDDCTIQICDFGLARSLKGVSKPCNISDFTTASTSSVIEEGTPKDGSNRSFCGGEGSTSSGAINHQTSRCPTFGSGSKTSESNSEPTLHMPSFEKPDTDSKSDTICGALKTTTDLN